MTYMTPFERHQHETSQRGQESGAGEAIPPKPKTWSGLHKSSHQPSQLYLWWQEQFRLSCAGQLNEIDIAKIQAAFDGIINAWSPVIRHQPKLISDFLGYCHKENSEKMNELWKELILFFKGDEIYNDCIGKIDLSRDLSTEIGDKIG